MNAQPSLAPTSVTSAAQAELTAYLDRVRAHRAELRDSVGVLERALEVPLARAAAWQSRVQAALVELSHDVDDHIALTERPGGVYDRATRSAPRLQGAVERLLSEHRQVRAEIASGLARLEGARAPDELPDLREQLTSLVGRLVRHRQAGGDLVYEAYEVDLGGSG